MKLSQSLQLHFFTRLFHLQICPVKDKMALKIITNVTWYKLLNKISLLYQ